MRGNRPLIEARQRGLCPAVVLVDLVPEVTKVSTDLALMGAFANVEIPDSDNIRRLDLRPLIGMHVIASGADSARVNEFHDAAVKAGAKRVMSMVLAKRGEELRFVDGRDSMAEA